MKRRLSRVVLGFVRGTQRQQIRHKGCQSKLVFSRKTSKFPTLEPAMMECLRIAVVVFCLVQCMSFRTRSIKDEIRVDGKKIVSINVREKGALFFTNKYSVGIEFATMNQHGMLVYMGRRRTRKDFLIVELVYHSFTIQRVWRHHNAKIGWSWNDKFDVTLDYKRWS